MCSPSRPAGTHHPRSCSSEPARPNPRASEGTHSTPGLWADSVRIHNSPHLRLAWFCQNQCLSHRQSGQLVLDSLAYPGPTVKANIRAIYYLGAKEDIRNQYRLEACSQITPSWWTCFHTWVLKADFLRTHTLHTGPHHVDNIHSSYMNTDLERQARVQTPMISSTQACTQEPTEPGHTCVLHAHVDYTLILCEDTQRTHTPIFFLV